MVPSAVRKKQKCLTDKTEVTGRRKALGAAKKVMIHRILNRKSDLEYRPCN